MVSPLAGYDSHMPIVNCIEEHFVRRGRRPGRRGAPRSAQHGRTMERSVHDALRASAPAQGAQTNSMHHGGSFGRYMELKNRKLGEQFGQQQREVEAAGQQRSNIFRGVAIHVNGLTSPSHQARVALLRRWRAGPGRSSLPARACHTSTTRRGWRNELPSSCPQGSLRYRP